MDRSVKNKSILDRFCIDFCNIVDKHSKYIIVSGFVAIASGRSRGTEDIDMIIERLSLDRFNLLHKDLKKNGFECIQSSSGGEIFKYLDTNNSVRYTRKKMPVPEMEMKFAKDIIDNYQLLKRQKIPFTRLPVWFSSINHNIAFKEEYLKSKKNLDDAKHLRIVYADEINEKKIQKIKSMIRRVKL